jgi:hypothetical protein
MTTAITAFEPADVQSAADEARRAALEFVEANKVAVVDQATLVAANAVRLALDERRKGIAARLANPKSWAYNLHKWFCTLEKQAMTPYDVLDRYEADQIRAFDEAERKRRQERERAIADARQRADQERATVEAAALERAGEHQMAAAVVAQALDAAPPVVVLADEVAAIQSFRKTWHWRPVNLDIVPREFLTLDTVKLNRYATGMGDTASVPGIEFYFTKDPIRK